jgi:hypothetical protein
MGQEIAGLRGARDGKARKIGSAIDQETQITGSAMHQIAKCQEVYA